MEAADYVCRWATTADVDAIGKMTGAAYIAGGHLTEEDSYLDTLRDVVPRLKDTLVLTDESGDVVAAIAILPGGHPLGESAEACEWEFRFLAVRADRWGRGLGRRLVAIAEDLARVAGAEHMTLRVIDSNPRAQGLYERLGYERFPDRDITFESSTEPVRVMTLYLLAKSLI